MTQTVLVTNTTVTYCTKISKNHHWDIFCSVCR